MQHPRSSATRRAVAAMVGIAAGMAVQAPAWALELPSASPLAEPACPIAQGLARTILAMQPGAEAVCSLPSQQLTYVTVYDPPGPVPPLRRTHTGLANVPTPLDVDGTFTPDVVATLTGLGTSGAALSVSRAPAIGAPTELPLSVEAIVRLPQGGERMAAVGYDALAATAPDRFDAVFDFQGDTTSVTLDTTGTGPTLAATGEQFTPGSDGARNDPQRIRAGFTPVPATTTFAVATSATASHFIATTVTPTTVDLDAHYATGARAVTLDARIDRLPASLAVDLAESGSAAKRLTHRASAPIDDLDVVLRETDGDAVVQEATLKLEDVPTEVDFSQPGVESIEVAANAPIGLVEGGFARGGRVRTLDAVANPAYAYIHDDGGVSSRALRALGVRNATATIDEDVSLQARLQPGPFRLLLADGARTIDGVVRDLPAEISLNVSPAGGRVEYAGSAAIGAIALQAHDPDGLLGRATSVELALASLPQALTLTVSQAGSYVSVDAHGRQVGVLQLAATNGPSPTLPPAADGLQVIDRGAPYLLFARMTGLRSVWASVAPSPGLFIDTAGGGTFEVDLSTAPDTYMRATLTTLQPATSIRFSPTTDGWRLNYSAAGPGGKLSFASNGDDHTDWLEAELTPLPSVIKVCSSSNGDCSDSGGSSANAGAMHVVASHPSTVRMFVCEEPLHGCRRENAREYTDIVDLAVRFLASDMNVASNGLSGRAFLDTDGMPVTGQIFKKFGHPIVERVVMNLPPGFMAQDRIVVWPGDLTTVEECVTVPTVGRVCNQVPSVSPFSRNGSIICPAGTDIRVEIALAPDPDVKGMLC